MFQKGFFFEDNADSAKRAYQFVGKSDLYSPEKGYGFVTEKNYYEQKRLQIPEINSGFKPVKMLNKRPVPTMFKADVESEGNYKIEMVAENDGRDALIFTERRRLAYFGTFEGIKKFSFIANVCDFIPRDYTEVFIDTDLDISWVGEGLRIHSIKITEVEVPTIYIAGDSTVTDQPADYPYSPGTSYSGWGQMLSGFTNNMIAVSNHSHSGLSTETFRNEGHYAIVEKYIKPGDYLIMQFGHNDQKLAHLKEDTGYRENLTRFINEAREKGAYPIIVTSLARNTWLNSGESYNDLLKAYAAECIRLGKELSVPVVDLHAFSMDLVIKNGLVESKKYYYPGDLSHTNDYGAYLMAGYVAGALHEIGKKGPEAYKIFAKVMKKDRPSWEINPALLELPTINNEEKKEDEPYKLKMDRLEEIIRGNR